ncbi:hypothetical protein AAG906_011900 [Vitis piasezkii]
MSGISSAKFNVVKFDGYGNFGLWQRRVKDLLVQQGMDLEAKAAATIRLCLANDVMYHVTDEESPAAIWLKLESRYMSKSLTNKLYLKQKLYGLKMAESSDLSQHINIFNQIMNEDKALMLLNSLPASSTYENLITSILLGFNQRKKATDESSQGEGLVAKSNQERGRNKKRKDIQCYKCEKKGHMKRDLAEEDSKSGDGDMLSLSSSSDHLIDYWIMDSTCSYHMTPNKDWFNTYRSANSGSILMGNDASCEVTRIGNIRIKMFDGVIRTLCDVRHVPDLRKNLISLGTLDCNEFSYKSTSGVMTVSKGAMTMMKGQKLAGNIYKLLGTTIIGGVATAESESDSTILGHMRLGHMGERGMMELHKRNMLKDIKTCKLDFCKYCVFGKQNKVQFKTITHKTKGVLDYVHADVYFMRHKSETFAKFKLWKTENGVTERMNKTIAERARYLRLNAGLEKKFWAETVNMACYLINRSPKAALDGKVAEEVCTGNSKVMKGFKLWDLKENKVVISRDVVFYEKPMLQWKSSSEDQQHHSIAMDRPRRTIKPPIRYDFEDLVSYALITSSGDPTTFQEAIHNQEKSRWMSAMVEKIRSLHKSQTWDLMELPEGKRTIGCKWGEKFKARLVAKVYSQRKWVDYDEIFSLVVRHTSIRTLEQMDVKITFLHGDLEELVYMQSPRQWYKHFDSYMIKIGYKRCEYNCCVYVKNLDEDSSFIFLLLYGDDMLIVAKSMVKVNKLKSLLSKEFDMKDLGTTKKILGIEIHRNRASRRLWLSQYSYVKKVLERFNMDDAKPVSTPLANHFRLSTNQCPKTDDEVKNMSKVSYASVVGCLVYAMVCTRPDLAHAVSVVSKFLSNSGRMHWDVVKWIFGYLRGTTNYGIMFSKQQSDPSIKGYVNVDYAGNLDDRRSTIGYVFTLDGVQLYYDSQSAIYLTKNQVHTSENAADMLTKVVTT